MNSTVNSRLNRDSSCFFRSRSPIEQAKPERCCFLPIENSLCFWYPLKEDEEGVAKLSRTMEELYQIAADEAAWKKTVEVVHEFAKMGLSYEQIAQGTKITVERVQEIIGQRST